MPAYEHTTRELFRSKVYDRLGEESAVDFWPEAEINLTIEEALLTFGAVSNFWRETISFVTEENKLLYDLFSDVVAGSEFIYPTYTCQRIIDWINRDLIENISSVSPNTEFWTLDELLKSIQSKYNLYHQLTSLVINQIELNAPPNQSQIILPDNLIDIVRVVFVADDGRETLLLWTDEAELSYFSQETMENYGLAKFYVSAIDKTKVLKIYPSPNINGKVKILFVGGMSDPMLISSDIKLPNNLVPYIKFGVEMEIFSKEGVTQDLARAAYAKQRWEEGIAIGLNYTSALLAKANDRMILMDSMTNIDLYMDAIKVFTPPTILGFAGYNLFTTDITPSAALSSIDLLVIANAKIPANDGDFIRVDIEYIPALVNYVVHLLKMKSGAAELAQTEDLKNNFLETAINHNERLQLRGVTYESLVGITKKEERSNQRVVRQ